MSVFTSSALARANKKQHKLLARRQAGSGTRHSAAGSLARRMGLPVRLFDKTFDKSTRHTNYFSGCDKRSSAEALARSLLCLPLFALPLSCSQEDATPAEAASGSAAQGASGGTPAAMAGASTAAGAETSGAGTPAGGNGTGGGAEPGGAASGGGYAGQTAGGGAGAAAGGGAAGDAAAGAAGRGGAASAGGWTTLAEKVCPDGPFEEDPVPEDVSVQTLCTDLDFIEGAVWFGDSMSLYFSNFDINSASDNFNGSIMQYTPGGDCSEFVPNTGTNGLAIGLDGNLVACRHLDQTLTVFDVGTGADSVLVTDYEGSHFSSPNDATVRGDGNIYFTDPTYQLGDRDQELPESVYRRDPEGNLSVVEVLDGERPNGITLSPDETLLYVAVMAQNEVLVYDLDATGAASNGRTFIEGASSDGMGIDCAGNLYLTGRRSVDVYDPEGNGIDSISVNNASNLGFGGPERTTLFITAGSELRSVELSVPGLPY